MTRSRTNWKVRDHVLTIGERTLIMGVLNVTPDSFSDGGKYLDPDAAVERAVQLEEEGADLIDIGAESTRPGSERINAGEELRRLVPVLKRLKGRINVPISVDTYKVEVAEKALEHGASIINDISALTWEPDLVKPVVQNDAGLILNHMRGTPETWARLGPMKDVMSTLLSELEAAIHRATRAGVARDRVVIDPGIGFGKRGDQNHEILARLGELQKFGLPVLAAASRKSFLANAEDPRALEFATAAAVTAAILHGAAIVRVHDVTAMRPVVQAADAIVEATPEKEDKARPEKKRAEETIEEKRRKPIRPIMKERTAPTSVPVVASAPEIEEVEEPEATGQGTPTKAAPPQDEAPRRPFERRAAVPPEPRDRPSRGDDDRKAPPKKFFEWRDDRPDKKSSDRRARPAGPRKDDRARDDRAGDNRRDDRGREDRPARPPFRRAEGPPQGDRPARPPFRRADGPPQGDRPARPPFRRADGPPQGDRPERRPYQRSDAPPGRGGLRDSRGGTGGDRPPRKPYQRADEDRPNRRPSGGRPAFSPRDNDRGGGPPARSGGGRPPAGGRSGGPPARGGSAGPRREDRGDRPAGGPGSRPPRTPFGGPKRGGGGPPPRGPRKRT